MPPRTIGLLLAALALPGLASPARALEASPSDILAEPDQFDGRPVALRGTIADLRELGATTYTFTLDDGKRAIQVLRSEERRVGKECRSRWWPYQRKKKKRQGEGRQKHGT